MAVSRVLCTARRPVRGCEVSSGAKAPMSATPSSSKPNPLTVSATPAQSSPHYCTLRVRSWTRSLSLLPGPRGRSPPSRSTAPFSFAIALMLCLVRRLRILTSPLVRRRRSDDLERSGSSSPTTPRDPHTPSSRRPPARQQRCDRRSSRQRWSRWQGCRVERRREGLGVREPGDGEAKTSPSP